MGAWNPSFSMMANHRVVIMSDECGESQDGAGSSSILVIVPAFNERASLPGVVADLRSNFPCGEIVVVNDGSTDGTAGVARFLGIRTIDLPFNLGVGSAVQAGLLYALRNGFDIVVQFDADGQHRADQLEVLLQPLIREQADVAIGSRFLVPSGYRPSSCRRIGMAVFRAVNSLLVGQRITDPTSGFRAFSRPVIQLLAEEYPHDWPEPEVIVTLHRRGFLVHDVAIEMRARQEGASSITLWRAVYYMIKVLLATVVGATRRGRDRLHVNPGLRQ